MKTCEDCGCRVYNGRCTNCHEELYILDQYIEQDMPLPDSNTPFMKKVVECEIDVYEKTKGAHLNDRDMEKHIEQLPDLKWKVNTEGL